MLLNYDFPVETFAVLTKLKNYSLEILRGSVVQVQAQTVKNCGCGLNFYNFNSSKKYL